MSTPTMFEEINQENKNIVTFLTQIYDYTPPNIPEPIINRILSDAGMPNSNRIVNRTLNIAIQKFITDVIKDSTKCAKQRMKAEKSSKKSPMDIQVVDVKSALNIRGIHVHRPDFIVSLPKQESSQ